MAVPDKLKVACELIRASELPSAIVRDSLKLLGG